MCVYMCGAYVCICVCVWVYGYVCVWIWVCLEHKCVYMFKDLSEYVCVCFCSHWVLDGGPRDSWRVKTLGDEETHVDAPPNQWPQPVLKSSGVQRKFHPTWVLGWPHTSWTSQARPPVPAPQITTRVTLIQLVLPSTSSWKPSDSNSHCIPELDTSLSFHYVSTIDAILNWHKALFIHLLLPRTVSTCKQVVSALYPRAQDWEHPLDTQ